MKRINVLCAMRDSRVVEGLRMQMDERYLFRTVDSGDAALICAERMPPDILIVDAVLPHLDGIGLIERMQGLFGDRMPEVIGGSVLSFSDGAFRRVGVTRLVSVPWNADELREQLTEIVAQMDNEVDWARAEKDYARAAELLRGLGMNEHLQGFAYLAWSAALARDDEERLYAIGERVYVPVAEHCRTTTQNVERLIRHAVERTADTVGADSIYGFFGNTIDPMRGKPTNSEIIGMLGERLRVS